MKSKLFLATFVTCALVAFGPASQAATAMRPSSGHTGSYQKRSKIKKAATNVEKGTKETGKEVGKGGQKAGEAVATGSEDVAKGTATAAKGAAKTTAKGVRKGEKATTRGVKKVGGGLKKVGKKL